MFPHPPFDLPPIPRPRTKRGNDMDGRACEVLEDCGRPIINPPPGTPLHMGGAAAAAQRARPAAAPAAPAAAAAAAVRSPVGGPQPAPAPVKAAPAAAGQGAWARAARPAPGPAQPGLPQAQQQPGSGGAWQPAPKPPLGAAAAAAAATAAAAVAAQPEDELGDLLGMMGIADAPGAGAEPAAAPWEQPAQPGAASWAQRAGGPEGGDEAAAPGWGPTPGEAALDEEQAYQAAIQASLADAAATAASRHAAAWQQLPPAQHAPAASSAAGGGDELALPGLRNEAGEYNCFLNAIVQCLWRCAEFRAQVGGASGGEQSGLDAAACSACI